MIFFFDNDFSPKIPRILVIMGHEACHLRDHFPADAPDVEWLERAGRERWVIVTADSRIRRNRAERMALQQANTPTIFVSGAVRHYEAREQVIWFIKHWPQVETALRKAGPGMIFEMSAHGKITEVCLTAKTPPRSR